MLHGGQAWELELDLRKKQKKRSKNNSTVLGGTGRRMFTRTERSGLSSLYPTRMRIKTFSVGKNHQNLSPAAPPQNNSKMVHYIERK